MPRDATHVILADETAKIIKNQDIFDNAEAFHMGCVADDAFLYTASPKLSTRLHGGLGDDTRGVIMEMMDQLKNEKEQAKASEKRAFIYGYLCHMAADLTFHPLIYSISGSQVKSNNRSMHDVELAKACHRYAETWLDMYLMKEKNLSLKKFKPLFKIGANIAMRIRLDDFFTDCCQNVLKAKKHTWGDNFNLQAQFHNGMTRQLLVDKITQNRIIAKMLRQMDKLFRGKLKLITSGFYNLEQEVPKRLTASSFIHPVTGKLINKSIKDLESDAVQCSVKYIRAAVDYIQSGDKEAFYRAVPNFNLDTGIENTTLKDINKRVTKQDYMSIVGNKRLVRRHLKARV